MADGEDPRDTLGALERQLRDLERELRSGTREDLHVAPVPVEPVAAPPRPGPSAVPEKVVEPEPEPEPARQAGEDVEVLVAETRGRVAELRESLDGLQGASDRLRSVAQDVVADHGRALVRLERATPPPVTPSHPEEPAPAPAPASPAPPSGDEAPPRRTAVRRIPWGAIAGLLALAVAVAALILVLVGDGDDGGPVRTATPTAAPAAAIAVTGAALEAAAVDGAAGGLSAIPGLQAIDPATLESEACGGRRPAVITVSSAQNATGLTCPGVTPVASATVAARGFVIGRAGRRCVSGTRARGLPTDTEMTARRAAAVGAVPRADAYVAGLEFDQRNGLRLLAGAEQPGAPCVIPTPESVTDGTYPLTSRIVVYAANGHKDDAAVKRAASVVRRAFAGTPPLHAVVLR